MSQGASPRQFVATSPAPVAKVPSSVCIDLLVLGFLHLCLGELRLLVGESSSWGREVRTSTSQNGKVVIRVKPNTFAIGLTHVKLSTLGARMQEVTKPHPKAKRAAPHRGSAACADAPSDQARQQASESVQDSFPSDSPRWIDSGFDSETWKTFSKSKREGL